MNGGHDTRLDGSVVVESLCHGSQAVGGAGCRGDDLVICGKGIVVYVENDGLEIISCGSRDDDLLGAGVDVRHGLLFRAVETGALENDVNTERAPRAVVGVLFGVDLDLLAVDDDRILGSFYGVKVLAELAAVGSLSGIVLEKVSEHCGSGEVVDGDYLIALCTEHLAECETADATETVNGNFY